MGLFKSLGKIAGGVLGFAVGGPKGAKVGASIGGGIAGAIGSKKASKKQAKSAKAAIDAQNAWYAQARADQAPYLQAGTNALARLQDPNAFTASPDYAFRRGEGMRGIQQTAAARGGLASGNALKALTEYNSNLASGEYGNWWNRQADIAGMGQNAANVVGQFGQGNAGNVGNALMAAGDARASGVIGATNSLTQGLSNAVDAYQYFKKPNALGSYAKNYVGNKYGNLA